MADDRYSHTVTCPRCNKAGTFHITENDGWAWLQRPTRSLGRSPEGFSARYGARFGDETATCLACGTTFPMFLRRF